ncbi:MAG: DUF2202 domain-containing protein, partial [Methylococcales bacterium]
MKKLIVKLAFILVMVTAIDASARGGGQGGGDSLQGMGLRQASAGANVTVLSAAEQDTVLFMREEEKMARDVYLTLYKTWKKPVFNNIAASEQRHMNAILKKLNLFGLLDPVLPKIGHFTNTDLQILYDQFITPGKLSYKDALAAGATIEDMDIRDLQAAIAATDNLRLKTTYQNLLEGSK